MPVDDVIRETVQSFTRASTRLVDKCQMKTTVLAKLSFKMPYILFSGKEIRTSIIFRGKGEFIQALSYIGLTLAGHASKNSK